MHFSAKSEPSTIGCWVRASQEFPECVILRFWDLHSLALYQLLNYNCNRARACVERSGVTLNAFSQNFDSWFISIFWLRVLRLATLSTVIISRYNKRRRNLYSAHLGFQLSLSCFHACYFITWFKYWILFTRGDGIVRTCRWVHDYFEEKVIIRILRRCKICPSI